MVPFLTNSLIRMYGWLVLLRKSGVINQVLLGTGVIHEPLSLMYNMSGILIGMTYTLLPFMILPLYSSVSTIDPSLLEAASDLGASKIKIFFKIIVPQTLPGLFNGSLMVFTPALGYFFIVDILGGNILVLVDVGHADIGHTNLLPLINKGGAALADIHNRQHFSALFAVF